MESEPALMEMSAAFGRGSLNKPLSDEARRYGVRWLRARVHNSARLRWNPVRINALELATKVGARALENSGAAETISEQDLRRALPPWDTESAGGRIRREECPF